MTKLSVAQKGRLLLLAQALESEEYSQCRDTLRHMNCFCASGVACDVYGQDPNNVGFWTEDDGFMAWNNDDEDFDYSGRDCPPPVRAYYGLTYEDESILLSLNDSLYFDFLSIGDVVRDFAKNGEWPPAILRSLRTVIAPGDQDAFEEEFGSCL